MGGRREWLRVWEGGRKSKRINRDWYRLRERERAREQETVPVRETASEDKFVLQDLDFSCRMSVSPAKNISCHILVVLPFCSYLFCGFSLAEDWRQLNHMSPTMCARHFKKRGNQSPFYFFAFYWEHTKFTALEQTSQKWVVVSSDWLRRFYNMYNT